MRRDARESRTSTRRAARRLHEKGMALVFTLLVMAGLMVLFSSAFQTSIANTLATRNYRGAAQVHLVAESAISQALQTANGPGVMNFQNDVVAQWETLYGSAPRPFAALPG